MEDFPRQSINLTEANGTLVTKTPKEALSKLPIQFALKGQISPFNTLS